MPEYQQQYDDRPQQPPRRTLTDQEMQLVLQMTGGKFSAMEMALIWHGFPTAAAFTDFQRFLYVCKAKGLDPLLNEVHAEVRFSRADKAYKMAIVTHIEAYRRLADESGNYDGQEEEYSETDGKLISCTVRVFRKDCAKPFSYTAWLSEYKADASSSNWTKMPHVMIRKVAEAGALREAHPKAISGVYIGEEMGRIPSEQEQAQPPDGPSAKPEPAPPVDPPELTALLSGIKDKYSMLDATGFMKDKVLQRTGSVDLYYEILSHHNVKKSTQFQTPRPAKEFIRELWNALANLPAKEESQEDDKHFEDERRDESQPGPRIVSPIQYESLLTYAQDKRDMSPSQLMELARELGTPDIQSGNWDGKTFGTMPETLYAAIREAIELPEDRPVRATRKGARA